MDKHTPGPWETGDVKNGKPCKGDPCRVFCDDQLGSMVADCDGSQVFLIKPAQKRANARLIAAAPDLLAALREALDGDEICSDGMRPKETGEHSAGCRDCQRILRARALLARIDAGAKFEQNGDGKCKR